MPQSKAKSLLIVLAVALVGAMIPAVLYVGAAIGTGADSVAGEPEESSESRELRFESDPSPTKPSDPSAASRETTTTAQISIDAAEQIARQIIIDRHGVESKNLVASNSTTSTLPTLGEQAYAFKLYDRSPGGQAFMIYLDIGGAEIDEEEWFEREREARVALYGKKDQRLTDRLRTAAVDELFPVVITLNKSCDSRRPDPDSEMTQQEIDTFLAREHERCIDAYAAVSNPIAARIVELGYKAEASTGWAAVDAELDADGIQEVETWQEIQDIYLADLTPVPE
jgi:hypothetical protein